MGDVAFHEVQPEGVSRRALDTSTGTRTLSVNGAIRRFIAVLTLIGGLIVGCKDTSWGPVEYSVAPVGDWFVSTDGDDAANSGRTPESAFATIERASQEARPGDTIIVLGGVYSGGIETRSNGREDKRITYIADPPLAAKIDGSGHYAAWRNYGNYVDIVGFEVYGSRFLGISNLASYVRIESNWVHDLEVPNCNSPNGGAGIQHGNYDAKGSETIGNRVDSITPSGEYCNLIHGIYHSQFGGVISNNIVFNIMARGIQTWHAADAVTIANNLVWDTHTGILVGADDSDGNDYVVTNNILVFNVIGIRESGRNFGRNVYANNLMFENDFDYLMVSGRPEETVRGDPLFRDFKLNGFGDYRLSPGSPGIDAGTEVGGPSMDIVGQKRPHGKQFDIGPYEWIDGPL